MKDEEKRRNELLYELGDNLTQAQVLYSDVGRLEEIKEGLDKEGNSGIDRVSKVGRNFFVSAGLPKIVFDENPIDKRYRDIRMDYKNWLGGDKFDLGVIRSERRKNVGVSGFNGIGENDIKGGWEKL